MGCIRGAAGRAAQSGRLAKATAQSGRAGNLTFLPSEMGAGQKYVPCISALPAAGQAGLGWQV